MSDNVIDISTKRRQDSSKRVTLHMLQGVADTGTKPFLAVCSDNKIYWCKQLDNDHGWESTVNEVVVSVVGEVLGAPVRPWKIVDVPKELQGYWIPEGRYRLGSRPLFGSENLHTADRAVNEDIYSHTHDDGNPNRIPLLIALQLLCNAEDIQFMYDSAEDNSIWSLDHGMWFGSQEFPWGFGDSNRRVGRPNIPNLRAKIDGLHWDKAIGALNLLNSDLRELVYAALPEEWAVQRTDSDRLVDYILGRREYVADELRRYKARSGRR